jgi:membrane-associated phospholipid phosphatase
MENFKKLYFLSSFKFFIFVCLVTFFLFKFLDIFLFKLSRSSPALLFDFFKNIIDPISDIFDPFNLIVVSGVFLILNLKIKLILKNKEKLKILKTKTDLTLDEILKLFQYLSLVCKHFILSLVLAGVMCNVLKYIIGVSRPKYFFLQGYDRINFFNIEHKVNSFPSGHTQAAFTIAVLMIIYANRFFLQIMIIASLMGLSRIFMSMHFPSDLVAGAYLGALVPYILYKHFYEEKIESIKKNYNISFKDFIYENTVFKINSFSYFFKYKSSSIFFWLV